MLVRRLNPMRPAFGGSLATFDQMRRDVLSLLDAVARESADLPWAGVFPAMNVTQDANNFYVRAELPGVKVDDLDISAVNRTLTVKGHRPSTIENAEAGASYHRRERGGGEFSRSVTLPADFDNERVEARLTNGLLTLTLPKPEKAKPRRITVKSA
jgi:HSP20 family protein